MKKIVNAILAVLIATFSCSEYCCCGAVRVQVEGDSLASELAVIRNAAEQNNCKDEDF